MIDLSKIFGRRKVASKDLAKDRLKLVLVHDRANSDTELLEEIKDEIMKVLEKYMDISDSGLGIPIHEVQAGYIIQRRTDVILIAGFPVYKKTLFRILYGSGKVSSYSRYQTCHTETIRSQDLI